MTGVESIARDAATASMDIVYVVLVIGCGIFILICIAWLVKYIGQFKHTIVLRRRTKGDTDLIWIDKYYVKKNKGEPEKIILKRLREAKPLPPETAKDITEKGREYVEAYIADTGELKYIHRENKPDSIDFDAIQTDDKEFYLSEYIHAADLYKNKKSILDVIAQNLPFIFLFLMFVMVLVFWEDVTRPMVALGQTNAATAEKISLAVDKIDQVINDRQVLADDVVNRPQEPPG